MTGKVDSLKELAARARKGNAFSQVKFREMLGAQLIHIVRLTLKEGKATTLVGRRILEEAGALARGPVARERAQHLIAEIANRICSFVMFHLQSRSQKDLLLDDTIRNSRQ